MRVYQDTQESAAGTVALSVANGIITGHVDVEVKAAYGTNRTLVIDI